ncbi:peroxide stress protein YaaA [Helicobacter sp. MIT 00-7814]|uniref:peroxide stress protein YaaA n=1 Tax=unclassified Helicobacter TaxID=2593540 RepID=UPI000E1E8791|nr:MULTISPECIES: peroxide stress protein YaaA [unclassified Helicobacter]RDU51495.1 peroxide stress protein YaaA [Helicobacter sp. MIT 00-7814]RDU53891.1 peroxide stress protein YaaA [Helicobacter sp. MIT 99-10781]
MTLLFSPSEGKNMPDFQGFKQSSAPLEYLFSTKTYKQNALNAYLHALRESDEKTLLSLFGTKELDLQMLSLCQNLLTSPRIEAIRLYSGVAYKALGFENLPKDSQNFLYENLLIFSNLFGTIRANDAIPFYNLHQNKGKGAFSLKTLFQAQDSDLQAFLQTHQSKQKSTQIIDLRAEIYIKFAPISLPHIQIEFLKNGKKLSHSSKFYRGIYARELALKCQNRAPKKLEKTEKLENIESLERIKFENLELVGKEYQNARTILRYEILT